MPHPLSPVAVIEAASAVFPLLFEAIKDDVDMQGRGGGYLCQADITGAPLLVAAIGTVIPEENRLRYVRNALEKANRLGLLYQQLGHLLSRDSANDRRERFIGGIAVPKRYIFSFSGLPGDGDEAFMILLAVRLGELSVNDGVLYVKHNKYHKQVRPLLDRVAP